MVGLNINPIATTSAPGTFGTTSFGQIAGMALDDPAMRHQLAGGLIAADEAFPMWGGVGIYEHIVGPARAQDQALGPTIGRATALTGTKQIAGFCVWNQSHNAINTPQSPAPLLLQGMTANFLRFGSLMRVPLPISDGLLDDEGLPTTSGLSWDYDAQVLIPGLAAWAQIAITSQTWAAGVVTVITAAPHPFAAGSVVELAGSVPAAYNGSKTIATAADNTHFTYSMPVDPGVSPASTPGHINAGGGILPVKLLEVLEGNSMVLVYDPVTGYATWNKTGSVGIVLL